MAVISPDLEFAMNPEPRCPCVLLLDVSGSMSGAPIAELNSGLRALQNALKENPLARLRVDLAIVAFESEVSLVQDFISAEDFVAPTLETGTYTSMGLAIDYGLQLLRERKREYRDHGIPYYRPWLFVITDGAPTDGETFPQAVQRLRAEEQAKGVSTFAVGVQGADLSTLALLGERAPLMLNGLDFEKLFVWLSNSLTRVSQTKPGEQAPLAPVDWAMLPAGTA
jgi:uncharacterized protein YegL